MFSEARDSCGLAIKSIQASDDWSSPLAGNKACKTSRVLQAEVYYLGTHRCLSAIEVVRTRKIADNDDGRHVTTACRQLRSLGPGSPARHRGRTQKSPLPVGN